MKKWIVMLAMLSLLTACAQAPEPESAELTELSAATSESANAEEAAVSPAAEEAADSAAPEDELPQAARLSAIPMAINRLISFFFFIVFSLLFFISLFVFTFFQFLLMQPFTHSQPDIPCLISQNVDTQTLLGTSRTACKTSFFTQPIDPTLGIQIAVHKIIALNVSLCIDLCSFKKASVDITGRTDLTLARSIHALPDHDITTG